MDTESPSLWGTEGSWISTRGVGPGSWHSRGRQVSEQMPAGLRLARAHGSGEKVGLRQGWKERWRQVRMPAQCQAEGQKGQALSDDDFWDLEHPVIPGVHPHLNPPGAIACYFL